MNIELEERHPDISSKAVPSKLWTIARLSSSTDRGYSEKDGLNLFDSWDAHGYCGRQWTYPYQIDYLWDKQDPDETDSMKDLFRDKLFYLSDGRYGATFKKQLFDDEQSAMEYLKREYLEQYLEFADSYINDREDTYVDMKKVVDLFASSEDSETATTVADIAELPYLRSIDIYATIYGYLICISYNMKILEMGVSLSVDPLPSGGSTLRFSFQHQLTEADEFDVDFYTVEEPGMDCLKAGVFYYYERDGVNIAVVNNGFAQAQILQKQLVTNNPI
jgi:hypothetical protein